MDEWTQLVGIPPEVPTASPSQLADPDSDLGQAAAAAGRLYYVDLVPRASRSSLDSPESGRLHSQCPADIPLRCCVRSHGVSQAVCHDYTPLASAASLRSPVPERCSCSLSVRAGSLRVTSSLEPGNRF